MLDGVVVPIQQMAYSILYFLAAIFWGLNQALLLVGYYILTITSWLSESMFQPLLSSIGNATDSLLLPAFTLAMLTLAITYLLGVFGVFRVVEFRSAFMWMLVAVMWFQFGPEIYLGFEQFRRNLSGGFYATTFTDLTGGGGSIQGLNQIGDGGTMNVNPPVNNFGAFLPFDISIDGLDIGLAYLNADGCDVLRTVGCLTMLLPNGTDGEMPTRWYTSGGYFDVTQHGFLYSGMTNQERQASLDAAATGIWRAMSGIVVSLFGVIEQIVQLLLTIAFGIAFASFFIAILFAFFKRTESVTWAVFDIILGLFIQSIITSLLLALVMAFVSVAGATGNGILLLGVGFLGIILATILLIGAVTAILKALNGLMGSFGQITGGNLNSAGSLTSVAGSYTTGVATLTSGGSVAQSIGSALGPGAAQSAYYASRAFGGSNTALGRIANDVASGASASYMGPAGGIALGLSGQRETANVWEAAGVMSGNRPISDLTLGTPIRANSEATLEQRSNQGADIRTDPLTSQQYEFTAQNNGQGLRTYEDGSHLQTNLEDVPLNRSRARDERQSRNTQNNDTISQDSINRIDASDDDENAIINDSIAQLGTTLTQTTNPSDVDANVSVAIESNNEPHDSEAENNSSNADNSSSTLSFLADIERDYPGSTGRSDLIQDSDSSHSHPENETSQIPSARLEDDVQAVPSVGPATASHLSQLGIMTVGQLANANPIDIASLDKITDARATQLVGAAQDYVGESSTDTQTITASSTSPDASQVAAAIDANNNDDAARLAVNVGTAVSNALNSGQVPNSQQATQIAVQAGLQEGKESAQFIQVASAMNITPQQAHEVVQDVGNNGQIGSETANSIRSTLATLKLPATGSSLDAAGMSRAVSNLERAAQALIMASKPSATDTSSSDSADHITSGNPTVVIANQPN